MVTSGAETPADIFIDLRGVVSETNPRTEETYRQGCVDICGLGLGEKFDKDRYGHLDAESAEILRWCVERGASSMWLPDSARTSARGFKHRLITKGPPVRVPLHRLSREATEWCEAAIQEHVARGQLKRGSSA